MAEPGHGHGRLPWPTPDELDPGPRELYDAIVASRGRGPRRFRLTDDDGRLEGPFNALLLSPAIGDAVQRLGAAVRFDGALDDRCREIAILTCGHGFDADYERYSHRALALAAGLSSAEVDALDSGAPAPITFSDREALVRRLTRALVTTEDWTDDEYAAGHAELGDDRLEELLTLVGYYRLLALQLRVWRVPNPQDPEDRRPGG
jgi:4-carboxymuconolactone decarboxylase